MPSPLLLLLEQAARPTTSPHTSDPDIGCLLIGECPFCARVEGSERDFERGQTAISRSAACRGLPPIGGGRHACRRAGLRRGRHRQPGSRIRPECPTLSARSEEHTSELQSLTNLVCRVL